MRRPLLTTQRRMIAVADVLPDAYSWCRIDRTAASELVRQARETARRNLARCGRGELAAGSTELRLRRSNISLCLSVPHLPWIEAGQSKDRRREGAHARRSIDGRKRKKGGEWSDCRECDGLKDVSRSATEAVQVRRVTVGDLFLHAALAQAHSRAAIEEARRLRAETAAIRSRFGSAYREVNDR